MRGTSFLQNSNPILTERNGICSDFVEREIPTLRNTYAMAQVFGIARHSQLSESGHGVTILGMNVDIPA